MERIIEEAGRLYQQYGAGDLDYLAQKLGVRVQEVLESETLKEAYFADLKAIVLRPGLPGHQRSYLLAHGLGHHLFHNNGPASDFVGLHQEQKCGQLAAGNAPPPRTEREADLFAAYLLIPEVKLRPLLQQKWVGEVEDPVLGLALEFRVPVELMRERLISEGIRR
jgi:Zn-dependent peptidase ImmA (M78 family)